MFEGFWLPWQQIYHLAFLFNFRTTPEVSGNFTSLKYVKSQRSYGFLTTKELIFGFQILDLKDHFSASLNRLKGSPRQLRCPITPSLLLLFREHVNLQNFDDSMQWACFCIAFFNLVCVLKNSR